MISDEEFFIDDQHPHVFDEDEGAVTWWVIRPFMVLMPAQSWAKIKTYIIQQCKRNGGCTENVGTWERKINDLDMKIKRD